IQSLWRNDTLDVWTGAEAESEKLPLLRTRHRALSLIHLELEHLHDELGNALHHPLPGPLAANVDITVSSPGESHPEALSEPYFVWRQLERLFSDNYPRVFSPRRGAGLRGGRGRRGANRLGWQERGKSRGLGR